MKCKYRTALSDQCFCRVACMYCTAEQESRCKSKIPDGTNADRIRSMSDEELAAILVAESLAEKIPFCQNKEECNEILDTADGTIPEEMCLKCALDWLRQPAKEDTNEV